MASCLRFCQKENVHVNGSIEKKKLMLSYSGFHNFIDFYFLMFIEDIKTSNRLNLFIP